MARLSIGNVSRDARSHGSRNAPFVPTAGAVSAAIGCRMRRERNRTSDHVPRRDLISRTPEDTYGAPAGKELMVARRRTSELLSELAVGDPNELVTLGEIVHRLEHKTFGALFLVLALPNCIPMLPGVPTITGLAMLLLAVQLVFGREEPWLPMRLRSRGFVRESFARVFDRALPWIEIFCRIGDETRAAVGRTEIVGPALVVRLQCGGVRIDIHAADRIDSHVGT